ncbi:FAD-binding oxidoreductase [Roseospira marina]|uniref:FAD-binding oxidoreductase n=1 Tax=Roseospira marina TaxID=140057 RepID=A0A5M6ICE8_9PROT|nr:FAD-binding oxidoreductase [Roseospira marina]KAA5605647.1 FAD-binding oxidoreductase [Roseospira marina]MBB4313277.1 D-lactate dehydrogenase (cytochrome) [Roseospira marina]MBB5085982.1 D-lactate dehydrogenase (cytochrome) [Roseospira marina]
MTVPTTAPAEANTDSLIARFVEIVGDKAVLATPEAMASHMVEPRGLFHGRARAVVKPATTEETAAVVAACHAAGVPVVPQGGNTGLVGGNVPFEHGGEVVISTARMRRIRHLDPVNLTVTVEAGVILADLQAEAEAADCLFPVSLAAEGSCQIGGNIASNAGGTGVLRYGNTREQVLGLEVVLPDGRIWNGLRRLGKDNAGYALRHLFIGSEGTLGLVTAATLRLYPKPVATATAFCGLSSLDNVTALLRHARAWSGDGVTAFEFMPRFGIEITCRHMPGCADPLEAPWPWYVLIELSSARPGAGDAGGVRDDLEGLLGEAFERGLVDDAVLAESLDQRDALWRLRESMSEAQGFEGGSIKHDVSLPVSDIPAFIARANQAVTEAMPGLRPCPFGHLGDGNVHYNLTQPEGMDKAAYLDQWDAMNRIVHDIVTEMDGSIAAEHGVGRIKVGELARLKSPVELDMMRAVKRAIDPDGRFNPGKVLP